MAEQYDENLLLGYVEDELEPADRAKVERMAEADPRLAQLLRHMAEDRRALRSVRAPAPPAWVMEEVDRQLERSMLLEPTAPEAPTAQAEPRHVIGRIGVFGAVAALLLIAGGVIVVSLSGLGGPQIAFNPEPNAEPEAAPTTGPVAMNDAGEKRASGEEAAQRGDGADASGLEVEPEASVSAQGDGAASSAARSMEKAERAGAGDAFAGRDAVAPADAAGADVAEADAAAGEDAGRAARGPVAERADDDEMDVFSELAETEVEAPAPPAATAAGRLEALGSGRATEAGADAAPSNEQLVLRVQTRDVDRSIERLNDATRQIARARLRAAAPTAMAGYDDRPNAEGLQRGASAGARVAGNASAGAKEGRAGKPAGGEGAEGGRGGLEQARRGEAVAALTARRRQVDGDAAADAPDGAQAPAEADVEAQAESDDAKVTALADTNTKDTAEGEAGGMAQSASAESTDGRAGASAEPKEARKEEAAEGAGPADAPARQVWLELEIPADQLETIVRLLNAAPSAEEAGEADGGMYQRAQVMREPVKALPLGRDEGLVAETRRNWPSDQPDYGRFLREQLPFVEGGDVKRRREAGGEAAVEDRSEGERMAPADEEAEQGREAEDALGRREGAVHGLVVPVVIEQYGELPEAVGGEAVVEGAAESDADAEAAPADDEADPSTEADRAPAEGEAEPAGDSDSDSDAEADAAAAEEATGDDDAAADGEARPDGEP